MRHLSTRSLVLAAVLLGCGDSDATPGGGEPSGGLDPSASYPTCSDVAEEAGGAVDALVQELGECSDDTDCVLVEDFPPSCSQRCPPVIAADQGDALRDGFATINAEHCLAVVGGCDWSAPSCLPVEPNCRDGRCAYSRGVEPARCPSGEPPELPEAGSCGDTSCADGEFCCETRGEPHFCAGPNSTCALDLCPPDDGGDAGDAETDGGGE